MFFRSILGPEKFREICEVSKIKVNLENLKTRINKSLTCKDVN
ncbi:Protein of unknown function [Pyronema omphalodes CBS 100304]|uniref:Uncharacterized protein n=1 Tax=Pyronema omphalodes (strain CBS 100304) TaxID=1076935 RepID=U4LJE0_PYROM|nr:Protein of unknown function [Pyronema omphalodes CBS 100304]